MREPELDETCSYIFYGAHHSPIPLACAMSILVQSPTHRGNSDASRCGRRSVGIGGVNVQMMCVFCDMHVSGI